MEHSTDRLDLIFDPANKEKLRKDNEAAREHAREAFAGIDYGRSYESLFELMWYSQMPCFDMINVTSAKNHQFGERLT